MKKNKLTIEEKFDKLMKKYPHYNEVNGICNEDFKYRGNVRCSVCKKIIHFDICYDNFDNKLVMIKVNSSQWRELSKQGMNEEVGNVHMIIREWIKRNRIRLIRRCYGSIGGHSKKTQKLFCDECYRITKLQQ